LTSESRGDFLWNFFYDCLKLLPRFPTRKGRHKWERKMWPRPLKPKSPTVVNSKPVFFFKYFCLIDDSVYIFQLLHPSQPNRRRGRTQHCWNNKNKLVVALASRSLCCSSFVPSFRCALC
jgi:hypothetical protein